MRGRGERAVAAHHLTQTGRWREVDVRGQGRPLQIHLDQCDRHVEIAGQGERQRERDGRAALAADGAGDPDDGRVSVGRQRQADVKLTEQFRCEPIGQRWEGGHGGLNAILDGGHTFPLDARIRASDDGQWRAGRAHTRPKGAVVVAGGPSRG